MNRRTFIKSVIFGLTATLSGAIRVIVGSLPCNSLGVELEKPYKMDLRPGAINSISPKELAEKRLFIQKSRHLGYTEYQRRRIELENYFNPKAKIEIKDRPKPKPFEYKNFGQPFSENKKTNRL